MPQEPYGVTLPPSFGDGRVDPSLAQEVDDYEACRQKLAAKAFMRRDQIGEILGARWHQPNRSFWMIQYKGSPVIVSRYYPEVKVALDIFKFIRNDEKREIAFKKEAFRKLGLKYAALSYSMELSALVPQIK